MPSNITQPLKSRHGDGDGSSAPTSKSNLNWLFYNRSIKNKFCLRLLLRDWLRMYSLSTLKSCCIIHFFKISLFKGILAKSILTSVPPQVIRLKLFSFMQLCEKQENDCQQIKKIINSKNQKLNDWNIKCSNFSLAYECIALSQGSLYCYQKKVSLKRNCTIQNKSQLNNA